MLWTSVTNGRLSLLMSPERTTSNHSRMRRRKSLRRSASVAPSAYVCTTRTTTTSAEREGDRVDGDGLVLDARADHADEQPGERRRHECRHVRAPSAPDWIETAMLTNVTHCGARTLASPPSSSRGAGRSLPPRRAGGEADWFIGTFMPAMQLTPADVGLSASERSSPLLTT